MYQILATPERPFAAILGGAKISGKIDVLKHLLGQADLLLVGGGMANTLLKAKGLEVGGSLVEEVSLAEAKQILEKAGERLILPPDVVVAHAPSDETTARTVSADQVSATVQILDIGSETIDLFKTKLAPARTIIWNGPLGAFETPPFAEGTMVVARLLADLDATTVVGGGDTVPALHRAGVEKEITHVSTGGGAFLDFVQGKELPGIAILQDG